MRHLLQPPVLAAASGAALISSLACYPRLALWLHQPHTIWYLEASLFICTIVLWSFVFAWHGPYTGRPVFSWRQKPTPFMAATLIAIVMSVVFYLWFDPTLKVKFSEEYPSDLRHWLASVLFTLALTDLFLVFAPCDWAMRLTRNQWVAMTFTACFAASVQAMKLHSLKTPVSMELAVALLALRFAGGFLAVWFYLRGGFLLVWWWALILESRHLFQLEG